MLQAVDAGAAVVARGLADVGVDVDAVLLTPTSHRPMARSLAMQPVPWQEQTRTLPQPTRQMPVFSSVPVPTSALAITRAWGWRVSFELARCDCAAPATTVAPIRWPRQAHGQAVLKGLELGQRQVRGRGQGS